MIHVVLHVLEPLELEGSDNAVRGAGGTGTTIVSSGWLSVGTLGAARLLGGYFQSDFQLHGSLLGRPVHGWDLKMNQASGIVWIQHHDWRELGLGRLSWHWVSPRRGVSGFKMA